MNKLIESNLVSLKWVMTISFFSAAILLTSNISISKYGFLLFLLGHALGALVFNVTKDKPMFYHNAVFIFIDLIGIYRWFY